MVSARDLSRLPVIDLSLFELGDPWRDQVAAQIDAASSEFGFFYLVGHGIEPGVIDPLLAAGRRFFSAEEAVKRRLQTQQRACVEELAARSADLEHFHFEAQLGGNGEPVATATPASGHAFVPEVPGLREPVLDYMRSLTGLSHKLMAMLARGLRLADSYFVDRYTGNPATSFRILNYPPVTAAMRAQSQVADYRADPGLLTILKLDASGGLELQSRQQWIPAFPIHNSFVCKIGEALAYLANGRYAAAAHRLHNNAATPRLSMSFCFEPALNAKLEPLAGVTAGASRPQPGDRLSAADPESGHRQIARSG
jgi:polar amino acid transport system ATP-binding protein